MVDSEVLIEVRGAAAVAGSTILFQDIDLTCRSGEWIVIAGRSGAGKSSLLGAVNGLCALSAGSIRTLGSCLPGRSAFDARSVWRRCGTVLQEIGLFESRTARENVELALAAARVPKRTRFARSMESLRRLGLADLADSYPCQLSGGQRQRVAVARATVARPRVLLLDEPTSSLDAPSAAIVHEILAELRNSGSGILMASHRVAECVGLCDRVVEMRQGCIVKDDHCATREDPFVPASQPEMVTVPTAAQGIRNGALASGLTRRDNEITLRGETWT